MKPSKKVLITGINGQDGSYLAELLLSKGYEVHGVIRRSSQESEQKLSNLSAIQSKIHLHAASIENPLFLYKLIAQIRPDECYHLAASSFVSYDFDDEASILAINFNSTHSLLSYIRELVPSCRFYFAASSEMFGVAESAPQSENSKFNPRSIYGIAKLASYHVVKSYRERHGLFACSGISYNHESPRRGFEFVTRKITSTVASISLGITDSLSLGNIEAKRDWGYSPDFIEAMWRILNKSEKPDDYVIATGELHSVLDLVKVAFETVQLDYKKYLKVDSKYFRPSENVPLVGDSSKIRTKLGWKPTKAFPEMIREMVARDIELLKQTKVLSKEMAEPSSFTIRKLPARKAGVGK